MLKEDAEIRIKYPLNLETIINAKKLEQYTIEDSGSDDEDCRIQETGIKTENQQEVKRESEEGEYFESSS